MTAPGDDGHGFGPDLRLKKRRQFLRVQSRGKKIWGTRFIFMILPGATDQSRLGITVSKKVGNAVVRNRIKRWVREVFRQHPQLFVKPIDLVVTAKRGVDDFSFATVRDEFIHVINRYYKSLGDRESGRRRRRRRGPRDRSRSGGDRSPPDRSV